MLKILHAADLHMDSAFASLPDGKAVQRRKEQRGLLERVAEAASDVDLVLLSGDLFDSEASYWETSETLTRVLSEIKAHIFIAPGNHDFWSSRSPYAFMELPENVHVFRTPQIRPVELPELKCRVWGAGYTASWCDPLLRSFNVPRSDTLELMVLHADTTPGSRYCPITEDEIARTGLDYLALGHLHAFSGIKKAGRTYYAYPGCLEGRGFDETGPKGVIKGTIDKDGCDLQFLPMGGREYRVIEADVTGSDSIVDAAKAAVGEGFPRDVARLILRGEYGGDADIEAVREALEDKFFHLTVKNELRSKRGLWDGAGEDTLTGLYLSKLRKMLDNVQDQESRELIELAARYGIAALEGREEWRP